MEENTKKFTDKSVIIGIVIIIVLIVIFGVLKTRGGDENKEEQENKDLVENMDQTALVANGLTDTLMNVRVPILASDMFEMEGAKKRGCDAVVFVEKTVLKSPAVLNATLKTMFETKDNFGYTPGNYVASNTQLTFEKAVIENGVAKVYLNGNVGPLGGSCDNPRLQIQVEEAALQFNTVNSVEIYVNGEMYQTPSEA